LANVEKGLKPSNTNCTLVRVSVPNVALRKAGMQPSQGDMYRFGGKITTKFETMAQLRR
jgi:hypothetical protein